jgi:hypothetical protein
MTQPLNIRFAATDAEVIVVDGTALLVFDTDKDGRVGVEMPRSVCEHLSEQLQSSLISSIDPSDHK